MRYVVKVNLSANGFVGIDNHYAENSFVTECNGDSIEDVKKYYAIGKIFNMGIWRDDRRRIHDDDMMHVTSAFIVENNEQTTAFVNHLGEKYGWDWRDYFNEEEYEKFELMGA